MYCQKCAQELHDDAIKCGNCGELVVRRHKYIESVLYVLAMIPLISSIVVWWWIIRVKTWDRFSETHPTIHSIIIISSAVSTGLVVWAGLSQLLSFIPQSWGSVSGEGEFTPLSMTISIIVGALAGITYLYVLGKIKVGEKQKLPAKTSELQPVVTSQGASKMDKLKGKFKVFSQRIVSVIKTEKPKEVDVQYCPECNKELRIPVSLIAKSIECPNCNASFESYRGTVLTKKTAS